MFETPHRTPYAFNLHVQDVGHTLVLGATGSGKSFLLNFLITHAQKYALSPAFLSAEVGLLDPPTPPKSNSKRARKGQRASKGDQRGAKVVKFPNENGSSGWIRAESPRTAGVRRGGLRTA